jgi:hypothetical protein
MIVDYMIMSSCFYPLICSTHWEGSPAWRCLKPQPCQEPDTRIRVWLVNDSYIQSVNRGLLTAAILGSLASGGGLVIFLLLFLTQGRWLVVWVPVVALALFTVGILHLLRKDANAQANPEKDRP